MQINQLEYWLTYLQAAFGDSSKAIRDLTHSWIAARLKTTHKLARKSLETYIPVALWGNQSDLSLFANASEVQQAQSQMATRDEHTVVNDLGAAVDYILTLQNGETIVFVLDNSGMIFFINLANNY